MTKSATPKEWARRFATWLCVLAITLVNAMNLAFAADGAGDDAKTQAPAKDVDSVEWYQQLLNDTRAAQAEGAASGEAPPGQPLRKSGVPTDRPIDPSQPIQAAGGGADIIQTEAGGYEVVPQTSPMEEGEPEATATNDEVPHSLTATELTELEQRHKWEATKWGFIFFAATVVLYLLFALMAGRKPRRSKEWLVDQTEG